MPHNNGIITAPVDTLGDVAAVLGRNTGDVGQLCGDVDGNGQSVNKINMWAKYRPIDGGGVGILTDDERRQYDWGIDAIPVWSTYIGRMKNFWYGIDTTGQNAPICGVKAAYWVKKVPTATFRLLDSDGYDHNAEAPFDGTIQVEVTLSGTVHVYYNQNSINPMALSYGDFTYGLIEGGDMYYGIMFYNASRNLLYYKTAQLSVSDGGAPGVSQVASGGTNTLFGTWQVFPFLSSVDVPTLSSSANLQGTFVALQDPQSITISRRNADYTLLMEYARRGTSRSIDYRFAIVNREIETLTGITAVVDFLDSSDNILATDTHTNLRANANQTTNFDYSHTFSGSSQILNVAKVRVSVTAMDQSYEPQMDTVNVDDL